MKYIWDFVLKNTDGDVFCQNIVIIIIYHYIAELYYFLRVPTNDDKNGSGDLRYCDFEDLSTKLVKSILARYDA